MTFDADLIYGQLAEQELTTLFCGDASKGYFPDYDLTIEVKHDRRWEETGNVAVEVLKKEKGKSVHSGISVSKAKLIVYKLGNKFWVCNREDLITYLRKLKQEHPEKLVWGGDGKRVGLMLVPIWDFLANLTFLSNAY